MRVRVRVKVRVRVRARVRVKVKAGIVVYAIPSKRFSIRHPGH